MKKKYPVVLIAATTCIHFLIFMDKVQEEPYTWEDKVYLCRGDVMDCGFYIYPFFILNIIYVAYFVYLLLFGIGAWKLKIIFGIKEHV